MPVRTYSFCARRRQRNVSRRCHLGLLLGLLAAQAGCNNAPDGPEQIANKFLREVKRENWPQAWTYVSLPSREKIRADSARLIAGAPYYVAEFQPERLSCSRFD